MDREKMIFRPIIPERVKVNSIWTQNYCRIMNNVLTKIRKSYAILKVKCENVKGGTINNNELDIIADSIDQEMIINQMEMVEIYNHEKC